MVSSFKFNGKIISLLLLYVYAALPVVSTYGQLLLYITIPSAAFLSFFSSRDKRLSKYMKLLLCLFIWIAFTSIFSTNFAVSFVWLRRLLAVFLLCLAIHQIGNEDRYIYWAYLIWIIIYVTLINYAQTSIVTNEIDLSTNRMTDRNLNANTLAYFTFFSTVIVYFWGDTSKVFGRVCRFLFLFIIPLSLYIALITASRQVLIIQIPLLVFLLYIRYIKGKKGVSIGFFILLSFIFISLIAQNVLQIYDSSFLSQRAQGDLDEDIRFVLILDGIKCGLDNFITGVGIGCFGFYNYGHDTFSHNTFIELFSTTGIIGLLIYSFMVLSFVFSQYKRYKKYKNNYFLIFMVIGIIYIIDNMFYVFHTDPWLMAFFILLTSHAEVFYNKEIRKVIK